MQSRVAAAYRVVPAEHRMGTDAANKTVHGPPVQSRVAAAYRAVPAARAMILAHMVMDRNGANATRAAGMGSRQRQADKAWQGKTRPL